jgi:hypothetical protein
MLRERGVLVVGEPRECRTAVFSSHTQCGGGGGGGSGEIRSVGPELGWQGNQNIIKIRKTKEEPNQPVRLLSSYENTNS